MIHIAETLSIRTVEGFLKPEEIEQLNLVMDDTLGSLGRDRTAQPAVPPSMRSPVTQPPRRRTSTSRSAGSR
ncbi:hypothetical protein WBG99_18525 [Streptomyces sp. TG1A-60]|uniref:hypothetical protein n=1 Tax=Streptomyces sp. TG1A-60 TaxID=3129111 RepID=UPI0030CF2823